MNTETSPGMRVIKGAAEFVAIVAVAAGMAAVLLLAFLHAVDQLVAQAVRAVMGMF